jgi:hypothetical protein
LVAQLKEHLANTPKEQLDAEWKELEEWNHVGPTVKEYLRSIKPAEWSEEDKRAIDRACVALRAYANGDLPEFLPSELISYADRLQSLHPQPKQEWSEEDESCWNLIWDILDGSFTASKKGYKKAAAWFLKNCPKGTKSLRPSWKPSEEQMKALLNAEGFLRAGLQHDSAKTIAELYEQLKKL